MSYSYVATVVSSAGSTDTITLHRSGSELSIKDLEFLVSGLAETSAPTDVIVVGVFPEHALTLHTWVWVTKYSRLVEVF